MLKKKKYNNNKTTTLKVLQLQYESDSQPKVLTDCGPNGLDF